MLLSNDLLNLLVIFFPNISSSEIITSPADSNSNPPEIFPVSISGTEKSAISEKSTLILFSGLKTTSASYSLNIF